HVVDTHRVVHQRLASESRVVASGRVVEKGLESNPGVLGAGGVKGEGIESLARVVAAGRDRAQGPAAVVCVVYLRMGGAAEKQRGHVANDLGERFHFNLHFEWPQGTVQ